jgi:cell division septum initiation protein DivIVA
VHRDPLNEVDRLASSLNAHFPVIANQIQAAQATADEARAMAAAAPQAAIEALRNERAEESRLRGQLAKKVAGLAEEACKRGFYDGQRRKANQSINAEIRDRFGVRDGMPTHRLALAIAYVDERHEKLTRPNKLDFDRQGHDEPYDDTDD